jgi:hypothetical protein
MGFHKKLKATGLRATDEITLTYATGADVVHAWDGYEEEVLQETGFASTVAELIASPGFKNDVIEDLRVNDLLEEYPRDHSGFQEFVSDVITDNFFEMDFIDRSTERYDYKRGFFNLEASVTATVGDILLAPEYIFTGWSTTVQTELGVLNIKS